jgi:hypothetical protein
LQILVSTLQIPVSTVPYPTPVLAFTSSPTLVVSVPSSRWSVAFPGRDFRPRRGVKHPRVRVDRGPAPVRVPARRPQSPVVPSSRENRLRPRTTPLHIRQRGLLTLPLGLTALARPEPHDGRRGSADSQQIGRHNPCPPRLLYRSNLTATPYADTIPFKRVSLFRVASHPTRHLVRRGSASEDAAGC